MTAQSLGSATIGMYLVTQQYSHSNRLIVVTKMTLVVINLKKILTQRHGFKLFEFVISY